MHKLTSLIAAASLLAGASAFAQGGGNDKASKPAQPAVKQPAKTTDKAVKLAVGDKAPALKVEKFIKGEEITGFEKGHVYVIEFWATWCPPCQKSIPHLTDLQKEYKDKNLTIIGVDVAEDRNGKYDASTLAAVEKFVKDKGDKMNYTVAYDGGAKAMDNAYMKAGGQNGIPAAFIVDGEGKIAWIGNPLDDNFKTQIKKVVGGKEKKKDKDAETAKKGG